MTKNKTLAEKVEEAAVSAAGIGVMAEYVANQMTGTLIGDTPVPYLSKVQLHQSFTMAALTETTLYANKTRRADPMIMIWTPEGVKGTYVDPKKETHKFFVPWSNVVMCEFA
jgi:hypothetical protein